MTPRVERRAVPPMIGDWPAQIHPVLRRVYAARGIASPADVDHKLAALLSPHALGGIDRACELLETAIGDDARIVVVGDFDCDGATGTAVAVRGLRLLGARHVDYAVPNRMRHGYGLSPAIVAEMLSRKPDVLITVDNGVAAHAGVAAAKAHGMRVIVTDHHLPGSTLPDADAIVNPNLDGDPFPSKALAGVGVMFYLLLALRARLRDRDDRRHLAEPDLSCLLDLVALGTVADLVPLDRNNRILVEAGLRRIRAGRACAGIVALLACGKRDPSRVVASDLGFAVGPRINAAGRLEDMTLGIECLLTDDANRAVELAQTLSSINAERRELQDGMTAQAQAEVEKWISARGADALPYGVVLFDPDWHHGVVGLVASKVKETLHRPVIACAPADPRTGELKASGRSIPGFHLRDALVEVDARHPGLIARFGGHAMAAGLSLNLADLATFGAAFDAVARSRLQPEMLDAVLLTDGELDASDFTLDLAQLLRYAGPWGQIFPEPVFEGEFAVESWKVVGERHLKLKLRHPGIANALDAIAFNNYAGEAPPARLHAAFQLDVNEWNGRQSLQLLIRHLEVA
ncbi:MAG: single-stranded-DNA-specific exonuclease RecJ [Xanthomonadaceae bacterium]|nr:single-stranded-DNA-specific exonuclease RecJ [Xanthomonadaceae bacterium]MDE1885772.1 single-stranded-DNA-specific exonuclease RecJ [Xanthomonadaceae bacterium]